MTSALVIPGDLVGDASKFDCGDGVYERNGQLYACTVGARTVEQVCDRHALCVPLCLICGVSVGRVRTELPRRKL